MGQRENMSKYDPKAVRTLAATLNAVAIVAVILAVISGFLVFGYCIIAMMTYSEKSQGLSVIMSVISGGLTFFAGYLISIVIRGVAHLMLGVVEIEANTASSSRRSSESYVPEALQSATHEEPEPPAHKKSAPILTDGQLMEKYGITFDGEKYHYRSYQYYRLKDAVNYAEMQTDA